MSRDKGGLETVKKIRDEQNRDKQNRDKQGLPSIYTISTLTSVCPSGVCVPHFQISDSCSCVTSYH